MTELEPANAPLTILLVDDEAAHRKLTRRALLENFKSARVIEESSLESLRARSASDLSLALIDFNLNGEPGVKVVQYLRSDLGLKELPIIIFSTSTMEDDIRQGYAAGADCFLFKAGDPAAFQHDLAAAVRYFTRSHARCI